MRAFGKHIKSLRENLYKNDKSFSLRGLAKKAQIQPSYLSKIERGLQQPPGEESIKRLSKSLNEDPDVLLALAGKISTELQTIILKRPQLFSKIIKELKTLPDHALLSIVREVRDGEW